MNTIKFDEELKDAMKKLDTCWITGDIENSSIQNADFLASNLGMDNIVRNIPRIAEKASSKTMNKKDMLWFQYFLESTKHRSEFIALMKINSSHKYAYNALINTHDDYQGLEDYPKVLEILKMLSKECINCPNELSKSSFRQPSEETFDCLVTAYGSSDMAFKSLNLQELIAVANLLPKYGYTPINTRGISEPYPISVCNQDWKDDVIRPFYELLKQWHGPHKAQKLINEKRFNSAKKYNFLKINDLQSPLRDDPVAFIETALTKKSKLYLEQLPMLIECLRNSYRMADIDNISPSMIKALYKKKLIITSDLDHMVNAKRIFKVEALESDLGL